MSEEEINQLAEKIKIAVLTSEEDFLKMKKRLGQKIVTRTPDYFLRKTKEKNPIQ